MGEIVNVFKELVAIKNGDFWYYTLDRSLTGGQPKTLSEIEGIVNQEYSTILTTTHVTENEFYIITNQPIPCKNC